MSVLGGLSEARKWIGLGAIVAVVLTILSLSAGPCRRKQKAPEAPPPIPGFVDEGTPATPPLTPQIVTETVYVRVPAVPLTLEQLVAEARKLGMTFPDNAPPVHFRLFAKEEFGPGPAGDKVTVSAIQTEDGGALDLQAVWKPYQPPTPPAAEVCDSEGGFVGNRARWSFWGGPTAVAAGGEFGLGAGGGASYDGFYLWKLQTRLAVSGAWSEETSGVVLATAGLSF